MISRGFCYLSILLFVAIQTREALRTLPSSDWMNGMPQSLATDPESKLARGERLDFREIDLYGIELISGMGEDLAPRVLEKKDTILLKAKDLECSQKFKALEIVKGVGIKTSRKLAEFVDLGMDGECEEGGS